MTDPAPHRGTGLLIERGIALALVAGLILGVLYVLRPFATAILFATILGIAVWPLRQALVRRGWRRGLVAALLVVLSICMILLPITLVAPTVIRQVTQGVAAAQAVVAAAPLTAPDWVTGMPFIGESLGGFWADVTMADGHWGALLEPYRASLTANAIKLAEGLGASLMQLLIALAVAGMFWFGGESMIDGLTEAADRLGGEVALRALTLAEGAVRGVAYGIVGTAAIQGLLMAVGLLLAGVPGSASLGFLTLLLGASQVLAPLILLIWGGAAWWLYDGGSLGWAIFMVAWGLVMVTGSEHLLRPILISRGFRMPLTLVLIGVFGGFIAFGFLGLFIGPTLLAIAFSLLEAWRANHPRPSKETPA